MPGHGAGRGRRGWGALVGAHTPRGFCLVSEKQSGARRLLTKVFGLPCPFSLLESAEWGLPGSAVRLFLLMMPPEALGPFTRDPAGGGCSPETSLPSHRAGGLGCLRDGLVALRGSFLPWQEQEQEQEQGQEGDPQAGLS